MTKNEMSVLKNEWNRLIVIYTEKSDFLASGYYRYDTPAYTDLKNQLFDISDKLTEIGFKLYENRFPGHEYMAYKDSVTSDIIGRKKFKLI